MYTIKRPSGDLRSVVDYFWELHVLPDHSSIVEYMFSYPFANLVINLSEGYTTIDSRGEVSRICGDRFIGGRFKPISYIHPSGNKLFGIKFRPGGTCAVATIPADRTINRLLHLSHFLGKKGADNLVSLRDEHDFDSRVMHAEAVLRRMADPVQLVHIEWLNSVMDPILEKSHFVVNIQAIASAHQQSVKTLERRFKRFIGRPPKEVFNALRCRAATREILKTGNYADCLDFGYYDQSHYNKELKHFTGNNVSALLARTKVEAYGRHATLGDTL